MAAPALIVDDKLLKEIEAYASRGMTLDKIANILGINTSTLHDYKNKYPEISNAWRKGKYKGCYAVANALFKKATEEGSVDAQKFYLSRRGGRQTEMVPIQALNLIPNRCSFCYGQKIVKYLVVSKQVHHFELQ